LLGWEGKGLVQPEIRQKRGFAIRGFFLRELDKEVLETEIQDVRIHPVEFLLGETAIEGLCILRGDRNVLGHNAYRKLSSEFYKQGSQSIDRVLHVSGKDEMADEDSFFRQGVAGIKTVQKSLLSEHLRDGGKGDIRIILAFGEPFRQNPVRIFEVRQIDVRVTFCSLEGTHGLVAGEIVDHGERISFAPQERDEFKYVREEMIRGHKINVVNMLLDDHFLNFRQEPFYLKVLAETLP
jgi:hypothetical protein